jgi:hypothetical protein
VRSYLAAHGPATRVDIEQFTGFRMRQIDLGSNERPWFGIAEPGS